MSRKRLLASENLLFLSLAVVCIGIAIGGDGASAALRYDHPAIGAGQWWRLLSGHLVHLGAAHLGLNLAGLALVAWLVGPRFGVPGWVWILAVSAASVSSSLYLLHPEIVWYVGLSGILHGMLAAGLLPGIVSRDRESVVLALLLAAKLGWEAVAGPLPGSEASAGGPVIVEAHLYGAIGGALAAFVWAGARRSV